MAKPATATARTFPSSIGVPENNRQAIIALLNARLADSSDLRSQVKWAHWNLKGMHFIQLHELFDSIASHLDDQTDSIAERTTTLGGVANGTVREAAAKSGLKEADLTAPPWSRCARLPLSAGRAICSVILHGLELKPRPCPINLSSQVALSTHASSLEQGSTAAFRKWHAPTPHAVRKWSRWPFAALI